MNNKYLDALTQIVRHPRHVANEEGGLTVCLARSLGYMPDDAPPTILDFSRGGCQLLSPVELREEEAVSIKLLDPASGLSLELPAVVRWSRPRADGLYACGCQFDQQVEFELLGELFLSGFLSTELEA